AALLVPGPDFWRDVSGGIGHRRVGHLVGSRLEWCFAIQLSAWMPGSSPTNLIYVLARSEATKQSRHEARRRKRTPLPLAGRGRGWGSPSTASVVAPPPLTLESELRSPRTPQGGGETTTHADWRVCQKPTTRSAVEGISRTKLT